MDLFDTATAQAAPAAATAAAADTASDNVSLDQLISEAVAAVSAETVTDTEQPSAAETTDKTAKDSESSANQSATAASVEGTSTAAAAEPAKEQSSDDARSAQDDAVSVQRARKILAEANRKEQQARQQLANAEQEFVKQLIANPRNFLGKHNKSIAELIDIDLGQEHDPLEQPKPKTEQQDVAKLVADAVKQALEEREQVRSIETRKSEIRSDIAKDQRFPMINRGREAETVLELMETYFNTHGKPIPWDKAAQMVETELRQRWGEPAVAEGAASRAAAAPAKQVPQRESTATSKPATVTTLTNNEIRSAGPPSDEEPTDPDQLIKWLVAREEKRQQSQAQ